MNDAPTSIFDPPNRVALTFDDGPNADASVTTRLLDILQQHGAVNATFFLVGEHIEVQPELVREIVRRGHAIGNHSYSHPRLSSLSRMEVRDELIRWGSAADAAQDDSGSTRRPFRAPYGDTGGHVAEVVAELDLQLVDWTFAPVDWQCDPRNTTKPIAADEIIARTVNRLDLNRPFEIVLLHDGCPKSERGNSWRVDRNQTLIAVERILDIYAGIKSFVTL